MNLSDKKKLHIINFLISLVLGLLLIGLIKLFVFDFIKISGHSMNPSIKDKETICINKLAYGLINPSYKDFIFQWAKPKQGDVVLFLHDNKIVIKRCLLIEGDSLEILLNKNYTSMYGLRIGETIIPITHEQKQWIENYSHVPEGFVFVAGDNLEHSIDSRDYGFVSVKNITGKIVGK